MSDVPQTAPQSNEVALPYWRVPFKFAVHAIVGTLIFAVIAGAAVLLSWGVAIVKEQNVEIIIVYGMKSCEYGLFAADIILFWVFLWRTFKRTLKQL